MAVILGGARTPFGKFGGGLKDFSSVELAVFTAKESIKKLGIDPLIIKEAIYGNVIQDDKNSAYIARHVALQAGLAESSSALTVNRLCGSGMESVILAARKINAQEADLILAGGSESMSNAPFVLKNARWGNKYGDSLAEDRLAQSLTDYFANITIGMTAENIANHFKITREDQDAWAILSQNRAEVARDAHIFSDEIVSLESKTRPAITLDHDEQIRGLSCSDQLRKLKPAFIKDGTITAGNASGINDGAASLLISSDQWAKDNHIKPLAKILGYSEVGCDPKMMGLGPVFAIPIALSRSGIKIEEIDRFEINEAYASQTLAVIRELKLNSNITNVNGGAIALGHPLGASGARITLTLAYELKRQNLKYGVASLCIGGGQGIAIVIENLNGK